jgi:Rrf2 family protein
MKLSLASNYALRALVHLAKENRDRFVPSHAIAEANGTPEQFQSKILKPLVVAGILYSIQGPHGGFRLTRRPEDISMLEVVEILEGPVRGWAAPAGAPEAAAINKRLDAECEKVAEIMRKRLRKVTIKDLAGKAT